MVMRWLERRLVKLVQCWLSTPPPGEPIDTSPFLKILKKRVLDDSDA